MSDSIFTVLILFFFSLLFGTPAFFAGRWLYGKMGIFGALIGIAVLGFAVTIFAYGLSQGNVNYNRLDLRYIPALVGLLAFFLPAILPRKWLYRTPKKQPTPQATATDEAYKHERERRRDEQEHEKELIKLRMKEAKLQDKLRKNRELDERRRLQLENAASARKVNVFLMPLEYLKNRINPMQIEARDIRELPENKAKMIEYKEWEDK